MFAGRKVKANPGTAAHQHTVPHNSNIHSMLQVWEGLYPNLQTKFIPNTFHQLPKLPHNAPPHTTNTPGTLFLLPSFLATYHLIGTSTIHLSPVFINSVFTNDNPDLDHQGLPPTHVDPQHVGHVLAGYQHF